MSKTRIENMLQDLHLRLHPREMKRRMENKLITVQVDLDPYILEQLQVVYSEFTRDNYQPGFKPEYSDLVKIAVYQCLESMEVVLQIWRETADAKAAGGRTDYLYNENGEEYYTTQDGVRHYTRLEG